MKHLILYLVAFCTATSAHAFSLRGPLEPWMTTNLDYGRVGDFGGPMLPGNEYRWNLPMLTYGFDQSFVEFFGDRGVRAVEEAIAILNAVPPASQIDVDAFPSDTRLINFDAQMVELIDLKSAALALLVQQLGLAEPEKSVWTLRARQVSGAYTNYAVIQRNYDPGTLSPSSFINGTEFSYQIFELKSEAGWWFATSTTCPTDAMKSTDNAVAQYGVNGRTIYVCGQFNYHDQPGIYYTGLTSDDVGGLRYLYHPTNINVEPLLPGITLVETNSSMVDVAPRPGVDKIIFTRMEWDTNHSSFRVMTNVFTDTYLSNGVPSRQTLQRVLAEPDIIFRARDLGLTISYAGRYGVDSYGITAPMYRVSGVSSWINNAALNGQPNAAGPGIIPGYRTIDFSASTHGHLTQLESPVTMVLPYLFGSFDSSTNTPVIYGSRYATSLTLESSITNQSFVWKLLGTYNATYRIDSTTNLVDWSLVTTVTNAHGYFSVTNLVNGPRQFYRAVRMAPSE